MSGQQGGSLVGGIVGGLIGSYFLGPAGFATGFALGSAVGGIAGGLLFPPDVKSPDVNAPQLTRASYGQPIPIIYGRMRVGSQLVWAAEFGRNTQTQDKIKTVHFSVDAIFTFCKGPVKEFVRVWADDLLIYDASEEFAVSPIYDSIRFFYGTEDQLPDPTYEQIVGVGNAPAYRGLAGVAFDNLDLREVFNRIPRIRAEIISERGVDTDIAEHYKIVNYPTTVRTKIEVGYWSPMAYRFDDGVIQILNVWPRANGASNLPDKADYPDGEAYRFNLDGSYIDTVPYTFPAHIQAEELDNINLIYLGQVGVSEVFWGQASRGGWILVDVVTDINVQLAFGNFNDNRVDNCRAVFINPQRERIYFVRNNVANTQTDFKLEVYNSAIQKIYTFTNIPVPMGATPAGLNAIANALFESMAIEEDDIHIWKMDENDIYCWALDYDTLTITEILHFDGTNQPPNLSEDVSLQAVPLTFGQGHAFAYDGVLYSFYDQENKNDNSIPAARLFMTHRFRRIQPEDGKIALSSIVDDICDLENLPDRDTSELTDIVSGYFVNNQISGRGAIEQLMRPYYFDGGEINGLIDFQKRKVGLTRSYAESELVKKMEITVTDDRDLPREINIRYLNELFETGHQTAKRLPVKTNQTVTIDAPIRMADADARQVAERWLFYLWTERLNYKFSLPPSSLDLNPMEIIEVTRPGETHRVRIRRLTYTAEGVIEVEGTAASSVDYTPLLPGGNTQREGVPQLTPPLYGPTDIVLLDIPLLENSHAVPGIYAGQTGTLEDWEGMSLFSSENNIDFTEQYATSQVTLIATAANALADAPAGQWDEINSLNVTVISAEDNQQLVSVTADDVLSFRKNTAVLGSEIIAFRDAELIGTQQYTLTGLARGLYGTEWATGLHAAGEELVLLEANNIDRITAAINAERHYKGVSFNTTIENTPSEPFTNTGVAQKPYAVNHLNHENQAGDAVMTWSRRSRFSPPQAFWASELAEAIERYDIEIEKAGSVIQTAQVSTETYTYTAADQTADGVVLGDVLTVRVWQVSASVGRGYVAELALVA